MIPLLSSYFQDRQMRARWHGHISEPRKLPGGGAMGATLGYCEFISQTNHNADFIPTENRFNFVDDLTVLAIINLLNVGLSSFNIKQQIASDVPTHSQWVHNYTVKSQTYLEQLVIVQKSSKRLIQECN